MALTKVKLIADGVIVQSNLDASHGITTADIGENASYLYYTDGRVSSYLSSNGYATQTDIVAAITDSAPATLDTLNELAAALGDDPNFATTTANSIGLKAPLASPSFTGIITANSSSSGDYVRLYGSSGTGKWDIYGNGANLRISDNESAGILVVDTGATFGGSINGSGIELSNYMQIKVDDAEIYWTNTANNDYWRWKRDASNNFILDHYNGSSTTAALTFNSTQNATFTGSVTVNNGNVQLVDSNKRITVDGSDIRIWQRSAADIQFLTNDLTRMTIDSSGNSTFNGNVTLSQPTNGAEAKLTLTSKSAAGNSRTGIIEYDADVEKIFFINEGSTVAAITSDAKVGIGTDSPSYKLTVADSTANGRAIQAVQSATSGTNWGFQGGAYGSGASKNIGLQVTAEGASTNYAALFTGGNVGIGTTSPVSDLTVDGANGVYIRNSAGAKLVFDDSDVADGSTPMVHIRGVDGNTIFSTANRNATTGLTTGSTERMRILSSGGITFNGDTSTANALDDYEEGTWTPTNLGSSGFSTEPTSFSGRYTKIGRQVIVSFALAGYSCGTGIKNIVIGGFPFIQHSAVHTETGYCSTYPHSDRRSGIVLDNSGGDSNNWFVSFKIDTAASNRTIRGTVIYTTT